jgi:hypothetical protein
MRTGSMLEPLFITGFLVVVQIRLQNLSQQIAAKRGGYEDRLKKELIVRLQSLRRQLVLKVRRIEHTALTENFAKMHD